MRRIIQRIRWYARFLLNRFIWFKSTAPYYFTFCDPAILAKRLINRLRLRSVVFYPESPKAGCGANKICRLLGYRIVNKIVRSADVVIHWKDATFKDIPKDLMRLSRERNVINISCRDVSKFRLEKGILETFGYGLTIDPVTHRGPCVMKSELNGLHDGRVITCPVKKPKEGYIYQRLVDNTIDGDWIQDIRAVIVCQTLPLVFARKRPITHRFGGPEQRAVYARPNEHLRPEEIESVLRLCRNLSLDYGEVDIVRDRVTGLIYVVDVNDTPYSPPKGMSFRQNHLSIKKMLRAFESSFLSSKKSNGD